MGKQRELYIGNLAAGVVTEQMLKELFTAMFTNVPGVNSAGAPVINCSLDTSGKFAFIEFRTEEMAAMAMALDKVELVGRQISIGRPRGYVDPVSGQPFSGNPTAALQQLMNQGASGANTIPLGEAVPIMNQLGAPPTSVIQLQNMVTQDMLQDDEEYNEIVDDIQSECAKSGQVKSIFVPRKGPHALKVFVHFDMIASASSAK